MLCGEAGQAARGSVSERVEDVLESWVNNERLGRVKTSRQGSHCSCLGRLFCGLGTVKDVEETWTNEWKVWEAKMVVLG